MRMAVVAVLAAMVAACGGEAALQEPATLTGGTWVEQDDTGFVWSTLEFTPDGRYDRAPRVWAGISYPGDELGSWTVEPQGLRLVPDGQPAETHVWELAGNRLRIWLAPPSHIVHEYARR
jgi:hypothetical protein